MAWCYYCRRYTVNGRCPVCNRMYEEPNKRYDFYGNEIKEKKPKTSKSSSSSSEGYADPYFWPAFWMGIGMNFGAIIIAAKTNKKKLPGAIVGAIINTIFTVHIITILIYSYLNAAGITF